MTPQDTLFWGLLGALRGDAARCRELKTVQDEAARTASAGAGGSALRAAVTFSAVLLPLVAVEHRVGGRSGSGCSAPPANVDAQGRRASWRGVLRSSWSFGGRDWERRAPTRPAVARALSVAGACAAPRCWRCSSRRRSRRCRRSAPAARGRGAAVAADHRAQCARRGAAAPRLLRAARRARRSSTRSVAGQLGARARRLEGPLASVGILRERQDLMHARPAAVDQRGLERQSLQHQPLGDARPGIQLEKPRGHAAHRAARPLARDGQRRGRRRDLRELVEDGSTARRRAAPCSASKS